MLRYVAPSLLVLIAACASGPEPVPAEEIAGVTDDGVVFRFASPELAATVLTAEDEYTAVLQPREIAIKALDASVTDWGGLAEKYEADLRAWTEADKEALRASIAAVLPKVNEIDQWLPDEILLTYNGIGVEGGLPHTRGNLITFGAGTDLEDGEGLRALFLHELHHVMSRANWDRRDDYFALLSFEPCAFDEPAGLEVLRLTNPDAPLYEHYMPVPVEGADGVIPYLFTSRAYDGTGTLGDYFGFGLLPVSADGGACIAEASDPSGLLQPGQSPEFLAKLGGNTGYIIHPEETLADNFVHWGLDRQGLPTPELPERVGAFWTEAK
ncbi:hypothetical protein [Parvularcula lutaonensis]|uniref:DUF2268 domain-containing protein n=1 Tax=Parvularcula lutaonensis TaxID=491923 RepID=A0ABV7M7U7_9PROT|nr:hypothetical protein [Parvularcula lutaonensis]GGY56614.1 hypothetical protein GCM10007148_27760 [Parvularcula lutaonensis]